MFPFLKSSLINTKIAQFYKINEIKNLNNDSEYFHENCTFNTKKIVEFLWPNSQSDKIFIDLENYKYEDFLQCFNKMLSIFQHTKSVLSDFNENFDEHLKLQWLGNNGNEYLNMSNNYYNSNITKTVEHTLILTSLLANALTNVYLSQTKRKHAPHLLKDLINSSEIVNVFGLEMVIILTILMGSPNSINLRNIVWHGFPKPREIPSYYVNVLLITIHSLGCTLEAKQLQIEDRYQITTFNEHIQIIEQDFQVKPINLEYVEEKLSAIDHEFKLYWQQLLCYYKLQKYKEFIILVLPQIELLLRLHYGAINNFDISAKLEEYYITMDTIFESQRDNSQVFSNKLLDFENAMFEGCFHLLYDVFISPNGCRLRDKVSHGEVYLEALNNLQLCSLMLNIFICLLLPREFSILDNYESKLHINCLTKAKLIMCLEKLKLFHINYLDNKQQLPLKQIDLEHKTVLIFKRPKKESELMLLINKIAENICKTILNYEESLTIRCSLLTQRELHSKRRKTLEKLQSALPDIFITLAKSLSAISTIYCVQQNNFSQLLEDNYSFEKTLRFLKHCLSITENFGKYSHCESNEWIKSLELCKKYNEIQKKLYLFAD